MHAFIEQHNSSTEPPDQIQGFLAYNSDLSPVGATAIHHNNGRSCVADIALPFGIFPRQLLISTLWYAFVQLGVSRLTMFISVTNLKSINLVEKLGAYRGATLIDGCREGDVYIYYLLPDRCRIWSKFYVKRRISTRSAGPEGNGQAPRGARPEDA